MIYNFLEGVCTSYTTLMCAHASGHCEQLNAVLVYAQTCEEYLCGFCVHVGEDGHLLHLGDQDSYEEREGQTSLLEGGDRGGLFLMLCAVRLVLRS